MSDKQRLLDELRTLVRVSLQLQERGALMGPLGRAMGEVDGYMRALLDAKLATSAELVRVVAEERARVRGPATRFADGLATA